MPHSRPPLGKRSVREWRPCGPAGFVSVMPQLDVKEGDNRRSDLAGKVRNASSASPPGSPHPDLVPTLSWEEFSRLWILVLGDRAMSKLVVG